MKAYYPQGLLFITLLCTQPTFALSVQDEIAAYNKSNYKEAIAIGDQLARENPSEADCHYFAANSYSRLGQIDNAVREYSACLLLTNDLQLKYYCNQALSFLGKTHLVSQPISTAGSSTPQAYRIHRPTAAPANMRVIHRMGSETIYAPTDNLSESQVQAIGKVQPALKIPPTGLVMSGPVYFNYAKGQFETGTPSDTLQYLNKLTAANPPQYNNIPGYMKSMPYQKRTYINQLFSGKPLPPPPFPASAKRAAETALKQKIQ